MNDPVFGVVLPIVPGTAHVPDSRVEALIVPVLVNPRDAPAPTSIAAAVFVPLVSAEKATAPPVIVLQPNPVPDVQMRALVAPEQDGIARPEGVVAVSEPRTVLAVWDARLALGRLPVTPVVKGNPVPLASVMVGAVPKTRAPVPVSPVTAAARLALEGVARKVATPVPRPVRPESGAAVAAIVPDPDTPRLAPVPTSIAAVVFVLPVRAEKAVEPPDGTAPPSTMSIPLVAATHR